MTNDSRQLKVLVIDDELGPRESLRFVLDREFQVVCAESVDDGIAKLKDVEPSVVILDIRMPGKDGIQGLREIRDIDPHVSVVMLTGFGALETAQEALRLGANDYIKKPFDKDEMLEVIRRHAQRSQVERRRRKAEDELKALNNGLMQELAQKDHLASLGQASAEFLHDLRNPLTIVLGYVQLLSEQLESVRESLGGGYHETAEYMDVIEKNVQRCHELAQMWQGFGKADLDRKEPTSLTELLADIVKGVEPLAAGESAQVEFQAEPEGTTVMGSRPQLLRAVHNIVSNAIQAVPQQDGHITVCCASEQDSVVIRVTDNGCGMEAEQVEKVFEPYFTTKPSGKGTGLGLFIAKKIIEDHAGAISIESQVDHGTTVTIRIPMHKAGKLAPVRSS